MEGSEVQVMKRETTDSSAHATDWGLSADPYGGAVWSFSIGATSSRAEQMTRITHVPREPEILIAADLQGLDEAQPDSSTGNFLLSLSEEPLFDVNVSIFNNSHQYVIEPNHWFVIPRTDWDTVYSFSVTANPDTFIEGGTVYPTTLATEVHSQVNSNHLNHLNHPQSLSLSYPSQDVRWESNSVCQGRLVHIQFPNRLLEQISPSFL